MSVGGRARELAFANGHRDMSARFVTIERSELKLKPVNIISKIIFRCGSG